MTSKRHVRDRECGKKQRYPTHDAAANAARSARRRGIVGASVTNVYKCKWCGKFHWGHAPG